MADTGEAVTSIEDLQRNSRAIMDAVVADQDLACAALANPILALEELGYRIDPALRPALERRLRFTAETATRLEQLQREVHDAAGRAFDLDDERELHMVLFDELRLPAPSAPDEPTRAVGSAQVSEQTSDAIPAEDLRRLTVPRPPQLRWAPTVADPLAMLDPSHPIVAPLLEYRRLEASEPRLASAALFASVREGRTKTPIVKVTVRRHREVSDG